MRRTPAAAAMALGLAGYGISSLIHAGLAMEAGRLGLGSGMGGRSEGGVDSRTAMLMEQPLGRWLVGLIGVGILGGSACTSCSVPLGPISSARCA